MAGGLPSVKQPAKNSPWPTGAVGNASLTVGAESSNTITVNGVMKNANAKTVPARCKFDWFLAQDANGDAMVASAPSGSVASGTNGHVHTYDSGKSGWGFTESNGTVDFVIVDSSTFSGYLIIVGNDGFVAAASGVITFT